jgi:hypothetical protein
LGLAAAGDDQGAKLVPFYVAYRAAVRAKVNGIKVGSNELSASARAKAQRDARAQWMLALSSLDLGFWSRFVVTFDFPKNKLYVRKGKQYSRPERQSVGVMSTSIKCDTASLSKLSKRAPHGFAPDPALSRFEI